MKEKFKGPQSQQDKEKAEEPNIWDGETILSNIKRIPDTKDLSVSDKPISKPEQTENPTDVLELL